MGVVSNPTGVLPSALGTHVVDALAAEPRINLVAAFGPEHGFRGDAQAGSGAGGTPVRDNRTGVPVYDIYLASGSKLQGVLRDSGVEVLLFDIQDVGTRFYTYIWTLYDLLVAVAGMGDMGPRVVVLDRPNPLGGILVEGPTMTTQLSSFVGRRPVCLRHGMTVGELAHLFNQEWVPSERVASGRRARLEVSAMEGWRRRMLWADTRLRWVPPSPNMPTAETALLYPGMGLVEGTNVSEGRGTCTPFQLTGAPWVDDAFLPALEEGLQAAGAAAVCREAYFTPTFSKFQGQQCRGVQLYASGDPAGYEALPPALAYLTTLKRLYPHKFAFRADGFFDNLAGTVVWRRMIEGGASVDELLAAVAAERDDFVAMRARYLMYEN